MNKQFDKLKEVLKENKRWPLAYMFKFIIPNQEGKVESVVDILPKEAKKSFKHTKSLKYVSLTCVLNMDSAEEIIAITESATAIQGVMML